MKGILNETEQPNLSSQTDNYIAETESGSSSPSSDIDCFEMYMKKMTRDKAKKRKLDDEARAAKPINMKRLNFAKTSTTP